MGIRNIVMSVAAAALFFGVFAQEPSSVVEGASSNTDTVAAEVVSSSENGEKTIVNIKSRRMFPVKVADSTIYAFVGDVVAYHNGTVMLCDSAVRYSENRIECFDNVLINKDSTYVYGDRVLYDRMSNTAQVFSPLIKMIDGSTILYTYNFRYNTLDNVGEYYGGGTISQERMLLESERGYYFGKTRDAVCVGDVELRDSAYQIVSDSLGFNMDSEIATFYRKTYIWNKKDEMLSANSGWYDTRTEHYHFMSDAYVLSEDQEVWADDMDYRPEREDVEMRRDIQILDEEQKVLAFGDYGRYWGARGDAMLTDSPSAISFYEKGDSLFMRADSIFLYTIDSTSIYSADYIGNQKKVVPVDTGEELIVTENSETDFVEEDDASPDIAHVGNDMIADTVAADAAADADNLPTMPTVENDGNVADSVKTEISASHAVATECVAETETETETTAAIKINDWEQSVLTKKQIRQARREARRKARDERRAIRESERAANVEETVVAEAKETSDVVSDTTSMAEDDLNVLADTMQNVAEQQPSDTTDEEEQERVMVGYRNVKIYRTDMQAICDSLVSFSRDTTIHMYQSPVMWNGANQIKSDTVVVFVKNENMDMAVFYGGDVYGNPVMSAELEFDRYNQITGKTITARFRDNEVYRTDVEGNAQTYYYMQDEESGAFQGFLVMECSDITFNINDKEIDEIIFRGDPVYAIYPMDLIPDGQEQQLPNFIWEGDKCPVKKEVFDREVRPSRRVEYESLPKPNFPLTDSIDRYRRSIMDDGIWRDRTDDITDDARQYMERLRAQGF